MAPTQKRVPAGRCSLAYSMPSLLVTDTLDTIVEGTAGGTDTIETALTTLSIAAIANVENLSYTGSSDFTGVGNGFSNLLQGGEGNDQLVGGAGNDTLNGSGGFDILTGGIGNDVYVVNDLFDTIFENAAEGTDTVRTALLNFSIAALGDLENIVFTGSANAIGTGNAANNRITSGGGNDTLLGAAGNDVLSSGLGNDTLVGGAGNDVLIGGGGADNSYGGTGDDIYYVSDIGDAIIETTSATGGIDTVRTTLTSLNLAAFAGVENVVFTGSADFSATGSAIGNQLTGGTGNDTLTDSLGGIDTLSGGAGNDILSSGAANDTLLGGSGNDTLNGGTGGDILYGGDGNDILKGGAGADQIIGGAGADTIVFDTAPTTPTADRITDYSVANDQISLSMAIFTSLGGETGALDGAMFYASATGLAHDANDRIIYNTASGALAYDANGNAAGGAVVFAILTTHPASVTAAEFAVI